MQLRTNITISQEFKELAVADIVLTFAFSLVMSGGLLSNGSGLLANMIYLLPIAFIAVTLGFVLHELMHKFVAQHYGAIAAFRTSTMGLSITLLTSLFGFLIGIPGATVIYTSNFTKKENAYVSLAGPLTNFAIFAIFLLVGFFTYPNFIKGSATTSVNNYFENMSLFVMFINLLLAFFNMLPIYPLDGSKVLAWNKGAYAATIGVIFVLAILFNVINIGYLIFMLIIALLFSMFYRNIPIG